MHLVINYELTNQVAWAAIQASRARRERGNNPVTSRSAQISPAACSPCSAPAAHNQ